MAGWVTTHESVLVSTSRFNGGATSAPTDSWTHRKVKHSAGRLVWRLKSNVSHPFLPEAYRQYGVTVFFDTKQNKTRKHYLTASIHGKRGVRY
ncbi:Short chain dehydrogenase sor7 [Fusarium oxysporum f. sp. albedinis]|nr:Short chain dehydrogenase sor7 [Fusarium oxysporum f. sp. albedinis]